jgi:NADH-quinone oxidoreductase subunit F
MAEAAKPQKDVTITLSGVTFVVPAGTKVKDAAAAAGLEIPALKVDASTCKGCTMCTKACETGAISGNKKEPHEIDPAKCIRCGECLAKCKTNSIVPA